MMMKNMVITGATGDIAREIINQVTGYNLILLSRHTESLQGVSDYLYQVDLSDETSIMQTCQEISQKFGTIDVLINNAGYGMFNDFLSESNKDIRQVFEVNVFAMMTVTKAFLPDMIAKKSGKIINIASIASYMATAKTTSYAASKFAVRGFSNALRQELYTANVGVLVVNTGPVLTKFHADNPDYLSRVGKHAVTAEFVAKKIVNNLNTQKMELNIPWQFNISRLFATVFPELTEKITRRFFNLK